MHSCKGYNTKQRSTILDIIQNHKEKHYTADELLEISKNNNTPVGKATLYRYLDYLVQNGEVKRFYIEDNTPARYQYSGDDCKEHYHLKCKKCGALIHAELDEMNKVYQMVSREYGFEIETSKLMFLGLCCECKGEESDE